MSASTTPAVSARSPTLAANGSPFTLRVFRHTWGVTGDLFAYFSDLKKSSAVPYIGVEGPLWSYTPERQKQLKRALVELDLDWIAMVMTDLPWKASDDVQYHIDEFKQQVADSLAFHTPVMINVHSGRDSWTVEQATQYFTAVLHHASTLRIPVVHETHRGRILYNPWVTRDMLARFPTLQLCADLSHWVCVAERLNWGDISHYSARIRHIHSRVGYEQGPQVPDPRAPEYAEHVTKHEQWWTAIWRAAVERGDGSINLTPEYGPADHDQGRYMHSQPYTMMPVVSQTEIVDWHANRLIQAFNTQPLLDHPKHANNTPAKH